MFNETNYISASALDFDANGDIAMTNTTVLAAPGAGYRIVLYGVNMSMAGSTSTTSGRLYLTNGTKASATILWQLRSQGVYPVQSDMSFSPGVKLDANTALKITGEEDSAQAYAFGTVYYRIERT
tara:strand:+ start:37 stop:411 length:375 start_codon:yes stop_codon:yes gene_type:complete